MIRFQAPTPAQRGWAQPLLMAEGLPLCDYSFPLLCCWRDAYSTEIAPLEQRLLVRLHNSQGTVYLWPAGRGDPRPALEAMLQDAHRQDEPLRLASLTAEHQTYLEEHYPGRFTFQALRDGFDYIYEIQRLAELPGKKLHAKRNHIRRFDEQFPDWLLEDITPANVPECVELERQWAALRQEEAGESADTVSEETVAVIEALYHMDKLGLEGALIRADGSPVAFSLGGLITPEVFDVNFEKSFGDIQGAYPAINREMARLVRARHPQVKWFNREDDLGLEGLRRAKLSYYPDLLLEKYTAREVSR